MADDENGKEELAEAGAGVGAAAVATFVDPVTGFALAGLTAVGRLFLRGAQRRRRQRVEEASHEIVKALGARLQLAPDSREMQEILDEYTIVGGPKADAVVLAFQEMLDATTKRSWPCLAAMTADYAHDDRSPDGFFRDATAVLTQLDDEGLVAAEALLIKVKSAEDELGPGREVVVNYNAPRGAEPHGELNFVNRERLEALPPDPAPAGVPRTIRILVAQAFGRGGPDRLLVRGDGEEKRCWRLLRYLELREGRSYDAR